jgi:hypothetical protein
MSGLKRSFPPRLVLASTAALVAGLVACLPPGAGANGARGTGTIEARVVVLGQPVAGVPVQARPVGRGGSDWVEDSTAVVDTTDRDGRVRFRGVAPGRYHVVGHCGLLPGDMIAGNIATRVDVTAGKTASGTLTLRRGGRILGLAVEGERPLSGVTLQTEATDALPSSCPMLQPRNPGPDGRFTVGKVPVATFVWVKALRPLGRGEVQVWKDFRLAQAETVTGTWNFPPLDSTQLGSVRIGVRLDAGGPADKGRLELLQIHPLPAEAPPGPDQPPSPPGGAHRQAGWRYTLSFDFTEKDSVTTLESLPPGEYTLRAIATPGVRQWWNAASDTLVIAPGGRHEKFLLARLRR